MITYFLIEATWIIFKKTGFSFSYVDLKNAELK
jgi:hypothetical protein